VVEELDEAALAALLGDSADDGEKAAPAKVSAAASPVPSGGRQLTFGF